MNRKLTSSQYNRFIKSYVAVFKGTRETAFSKGNEQWIILKKLDDNDKIEKEIDRMTLEIKSKQPQSLFTVWARKSVTNQNSSSILKSMEIAANVTSESDVSCVSAVSSCSHSIKSSKHNRICHSQVSVRQELDEITAKLNNIRALKTSMLLPIEAEKQLKVLENQRSACQKKLKRLEQTRTSQANFRKSRKLKLKKLMEKCPDVAREYNLDLHYQSGQPRIEERGQSGLLDVIVEIASRGAAADPSRSSNQISPCMTLDELTERLKLHGFILSRSATYLRLLPRRSNSIEGKRHVQTVPVRLKKATNDEHKKHEDQYFATNTINHLKTLAGSFGSDTVFFLSQDDKARVPIGLPAARKQAPLLMHLDYKISLPDHDFVVASRHKLIPSVYAACTINNKNEVTYSGPTYISIRSGKHSSSTAETHHYDFSLLFESKDFEPVMKVHGKCKPIVIISVDGGPDENPRFSKTLAGGVQLFKKYDLDCLFVVSNCPGRSAYNIVERRMAPLSNQLAGLILPHDYYGTHLDDNGNTINTELELQNFKRAGECLAEIWSELTIDSYPVVCRYIEPIVEKDSSSLNAKMLDLNWLTVHVRQSQYLLQIIKCNDLNCCPPWRTSYSKVIAQRFLPPPFLFKHSINGICATELNDKYGRFVDLYQRLQLDNLIPAAHIGYDYQCSSVQDEILKRTCSICFLYHPSSTAMIQHKKLHSSKYLKKQQAVVLAKKEQIQENNDNNNSEDEEDHSTNIDLRYCVGAHSVAPLIDNIFDFLASDFVEI
ncbi:unnamed protein product [Rotaria sp. Silwood2]|nr:unnamed protein product [Rotaria sp. Silwood2]